MSNKTISLFPLHSVLFPGGALPLRVFEPRYLDMIGKCMRNEEQFGIILISEGSEVGEAAQTFQIGTLGEISYFQQLKDGCLGITVRGVQRFHILSTNIEKNQLITAEVEIIDNEASLPMPEQYQYMVSKLKEIFEQLGQPFTNLPKDYENATWVSSRLAELLPLRLIQKQSLLEQTNTLNRLESLDRILHEMNYR